MNWLVVVVFATLAGDVYIFNDPAWETREECMASLTDPEMQPNYIAKLVLEYGKAMPIQFVNCLSEEQIDEILMGYTGKVKKGTNT